VVPGDPPSPSGDASAPGAAPDEPARARTNRFDRPPEPHDWRWAVGWTGRILISVGVLLFAFVAYQLWGTGIQTAQAQNRLEDEFEALLDTATSLPPTPTTAPPTTAPPTTVPDGAAPTTTAATDAATTTSSTVPPAVISPPPLGDPLGRLSIPSIGLEKILISGVRPGDLEDGPGHFPETPLPGQLGNAAIAGHRTTHGAPFLRIDEVEIGDDVVVQTLAGTYTYVVTGQQIVAPTDYQKVIPTVDPSTATLTLTSCHPRYSTRERIVITATIDLARSSLVTQRSVIPFDPALLPGVGASLPDEASGGGTTEPATTVSESTVPASTVPATTSPEATAPPTTDPATADPSTTAPAVTEGADPSVGQAGVDVFENRWFSDPDAFWQVAVWGLALIVVALAATALSRRTRRNWVGALVGIGPFVVVLYFWFENVNRLLPPNV